MSLLEVLEKGGLIVKAVAVFFFIVSLAIITLVTFNYVQVMNNWEKMVDIKTVLDSRTERFISLENKLEALQKEVQNLNEAEGLTPNTHMSSPHIEELDKNVTK